MRGILIISVNSARYGEMAYNLAVSLRTAHQGVPIAVLSDGSFEAAAEAMDPPVHIIPVDKGLNPFELKTQMWEHSPFEDTLYLDADSLMVRMPGLRVRSLAGLFNSWGTPDFRMMEYGRHNREGKGPLWGDLSTIMDHYGTPEGALFPEYNSSIILFNKSEKARDLFREAHKAYLDPCPLTELVGGYFPDEVAFGVASMRSGVYSDVEKWQPVYFGWNKEGGVPHVQKNFPFVSLAGGQQPAWLLNLYGGTVRRNSIDTGRTGYKFNHRNKVAFKK